MRILCITLTDRNKTVCGELPFIKDIFDRLAMILYGICLYIVKLPFLFVCV